MFLFVRKCYCFSEQYTFQVKTNTGTYSKYYNTVCALTTLMDFSNNILAKIDFCTLKFTVVISYDKLQDSMQSEFVKYLVY